MWQEQVTKMDMLPVERTEYGYTQRAHWRMADRVHEEVLELDSPHTMNVAAGTQVISFVLMGDQNAGKSTFLHAFAHHTDPSFMELSSLLPVLSAAFVNTRFLEASDARSARDELPFVDTDLGRSTFVLTADDFAFFVTEHDLDPALVLDAPRGTRFFAVQLIEFGGDHLDQMMDPSLCTSQTARDICDRSLRMLRNCHRVVYFANAATLFGGGKGNNNGRNGGNDHADVVTMVAATSPTASKKAIATIPGGAATIAGAATAAEQGGTDGVGVLDPVELARLQSRLTFLNQALPAGSNVHVQLSRAGIKVDTVQSISIAAATLHTIDVPTAPAAAGSTGPCETTSRSTFSTASMGVLPLPTAPTARAVLQWCLESFAATMADEWTIRVGPEVFTSEHLRPDGSLDPTAIVTTMARLFRRDMVHNVADAAHEVARCIWQCARSPNYRITPQDTFSLWVDRSVFHEWLEDAEPCTAPDTTLVQLFDRVAAGLADRGLCLRHNGANRQDTILRFKILKDGDEKEGEEAAGTSSAGRRCFCLWTPSAEVATYKGVVQVRFPFSPRILGVLETYFERELPGAAWLGALATSAPTPKSTVRDQVTFTDGSRPFLATGEDDVISAGNGEIVAVEEEEGSGGPLFVSGRDDGVRAALSEALEATAAELDTKWQEAVLASASLLGMDGAEAGAGANYASNNTLWERWLWLLEEWAAAHALLLHADSPLPHLVLPCPTKLWPPACEALSRQFMGSVGPFVPPDASARASSRIVDIEIALE